MREGQPAEQSAQFSIGNSPCMRGGQPRTPSPFEGDIGFSPHVRGSTHETDTVNSDGMIHPACAGVNPFSSIGLSMVLVYTPHVRGSTHVDIRELAPMEILPARAGVNLSREWLYEPVYSPRMRGDQPR